MMGVRKYKLYAHHYDGRLLLPLYGKSHKEAFLCQLKNSLK